MIHGLRPKIFRLNVSEHLATVVGSMLECVIIGYNERHVRTLAAACCGVEGENIWGNKNYTDCVEIGTPHKQSNYPQVLVRYVQEYFKSIETATATS